MVSMLILRGITGPVGQEEVSGTRTRQIEVSKSETLQINLKAKHTVSVCPVVPFCRCSPSSVCTPRGSYSRSKGLAMIRVLVLGLSFAAGSQKKFPLSCVHFDCAGEPAKCGEVGVF